MTDLLDISTLINTKKLNCFKVAKHIKLYLRNRSAPAVNCCVIIHCLEVSCKEDQISRLDTITYVQTGSRADPDGGQGSDPPPPPKNHKNIGFLSNTGPDPLKNHKAAKPAFNVGTSLARQRNAI